MGAMGFPFSRGGSAKPRQEKPWCHVLGTAEEELRECGMGRAGSGGVGGGRGKTGLLINLDERDVMPREAMLNEA